MLLTVTVDFKRFSSYRLFAKTVVNVVTQFAPANEFIREYINWISASRVVRLGMWHCVEWVWKNFRRIRIFCVTKNKSYNPGEILCGIRFPVSGNIILSAIEGRFPSNRDQINCLQRANNVCPHLDGSREQIEMWNTITYGNRCLTGNLTFRLRPRVDCVINSFLNWESKATASYFASGNTETIRKGRKGICGTNFDTENGKKTTNSFDFEVDSVRFIRFSTFWRFCKATVSVTNKGE